MEKIKEALLKRFQEHRVIFWYDGNKEFADEYENLSIEGVEKIEVFGNEFEVKYRIYKKESGLKYLLYLPYEKPANEDNWLLDLELANHVFHTDQEAMFLQELGLDYSLKELVSAHLDFFRSKERRYKLKEILSKDDDFHTVMCRMLAVIFDTPTTNLENFIQKYASQVLTDSKEFDKPLERFNLIDFFWNEVSRVYNYHSEEPTINDFLLDLFEQNFSLGKRRNLNSESRLILSTWKNTLPYRNYYGEISENIARDLQVEEALITAELEEVINDDIFKIIDLKVIHEMIQQLLADNLSFEKLSEYLKKRENKFWFENYQVFYNTIESGAKIISMVNSYEGLGNDFNKAVKDYTNKLYEIDLAYRKFIWNYRQTKNDSSLYELAQKVEKIYSNSWLLPYNNDWQQIVDNLTVWPTNNRESQQGFFKNHVQPILDKKQKLFVIISDALRFECGVELNNSIIAENRFSSELDYLVSSIPSYTQLGMASLLPHKKIEFKENGDNIILDGMSAAGIKGRIKILKENSGVRATAIKAEELMKMKSKSGGEGREFVKNHDLIYVYHDRIDDTGDGSKSEEKVFDAVKDELNFLKDILKKISGLNGTNVFITTDHGFIYQNEKLDESDFSIAKYEGDLWKEHRRFVIGKNLKGDNKTKMFRTSELNIGNKDVEVLIPKSINRLRVKGAGSRFIHGGTTPQETILPLLKTVVRKRSDTVSKVNIDIIKSTDKITTNLLPVSFIQQELVGDNILSRPIKAGIVAEDGELLSDQFTFIFDIEEGSERQREIKHQFHLSKKASGKYKNQRVRLILEEPVEKSSKWKLYKDFYYTLSITFSNDFD